MLTRFKCMCTCKCSKFHLKKCQLTCKSTAKKVDKSFLNNHNYVFDDLNYNPYKTIAQMSFENPYTQIKTSKSTEKMKENKHKLASKYIKKSKKTVASEKSKQNETRTVNFLNADKEVLSKPVVESVTNIPLVLDHLFPKNFIQIDNENKTEEDTCNQPEKPLSPKPNCRRIIEKKIKRVLEESLESDISDSFQIFDAKALLNFPVDKKLYKDLLSLKCYKKKLLPAEYNPHFVREKVPQLKNFFIPKPANEYAFNTKVTISPMTQVKHYYGYHVTRRVKIWNNPNEYTSWNCLDV